MKIEKIDRDNKKISLTLAETGEGKSAESEEDGDYKSYLPKSPRTMGTFGDILSKAKSKK